MGPSYHLAPKPQPPAPSLSPQAHLCQLVELLEHSAHILGKLLRRAVRGRQLLLEAGTDQGQVQGATRLILQGSPQDEGEARQTLPLPYSQVPGLTREKLESVASWCKGRQGSWQNRASRTRSHFYERYGNGHQSHGRGTGVGRGWTAAG